MNLRPPVARPIRLPVEAALAAAMSTPGDLDLALRRAFYERAVDVTLGVRSSDVPATLAALVDCVTRHAFKVRDDDIAAVLDAGHTQDAVFEAVVSTALGAGLTRLACGLAALEAAGTPASGAQAGASA